MLATLDTGIEGGKWFRLIDKFWSPKNLESSLQKLVAKGGSAGVDRIADVFCSRWRCHRRPLCCVFGVCLILGLVAQESRFRQAVVEFVRRTWVLLD